MNTLLNILRTEFEQFVIRMLAMWHVQHKDDGTHGAITADSITVTANSDTGATGDVAGVTGTFSGNVTAQDGGAQETTIGLVGSTTANDGSVGAGVDLASVWALLFNDAGGGSDRRWILIDLVSGMTPFMVRKASGGAFFIQPGPISHGAGMVANLGNPNDSFRGGFWDAIYVNAIYRASSSIAEGVWTPVAYAAGNFTASAGTWTVDAGDQSEFEFMLNGDTMFVNFSIFNTDVSNAGAVLRITIPNGMTCATDIQFPIRILNAGVSAVGLAVVQAGNTFIECFATIGAAGFSITAADDTYVIGAIFFKVT
jgi:hypothetical protein